MYSKPVSPQPIGSVLDSGFSLYRYSLRETFAFAFLSALVSAPISRIAQPSAADDLNVGLLAIASLVTLALTVVLYTPIIAKIHAVQSGKHLPAAEALALGIRRFPVVLAVAILYFVSVFLGLMLLLIPGIYIAVALMFSTLPAITESKGVLESLRYSFELVRGRWWRTAVLLTIISIVAMVLYLLVFFAIGLVVGIGSAGAAEELPWAVDFVVTPLVAGVLGPLFYALLMAIYLDSKLRHEGTDIAERIAAARA